jgi:hypothetical protein
MELEVQSRFTWLGIAISGIRNQLADHQLGSSAVLYKTCGGSAVALRRRARVRVCARATCQTRQPVRALTITSLSAFCTVAATGADTIRVVNSPKRMNQEIGVRPCRGVYKRVLRRGGAVYYYYCRLVPCKAVPRDSGGGSPSN